MHRPTRRALLAGGAAGVATLAGCFAGDPDDRPVGTGEAPWPEEPTWQPADGSPLDADVREVTAVRDLSIPWDLSFAGDDAFVTERTGGLLRFDAGALADESELAPADATTVLRPADLPGRSGPGEGGTLGVAVHPEYPSRRVVYVYYTADDGGLANRLVRYDMETDELAAIVDDIPAARFHNGGRIVVGPDDHLWLCNGDARSGEDAQDATTLAGSVARVDLDGEPVPDNPDFGADADPRLYTVGHRNPQGLAFTPDGEPLVTEHGPQSRDEVSALRPGANYGWNVARGGPGDLQYESYTDTEAFTPPLLNTGANATWAPSGATFYTDDAVPAWRNRLFVAGLRSQTLFSVTLIDGGSDGHSKERDIPGGTRFDAAWLDDRYTATVHELYDGAYGRLRHAEQGPDGALYLLTSNHDGRVVRGFPTDDDDRIVRIERR